MKIVLAQLNFCVGAIEKNRQKIAQTLHDLPQGVDLVVFTEMSISGYPLGDMVQRPDLIGKCQDALQRLAEEHREGPAILLGAPLQENVGGNFLDRVQNKNMVPIFNSVLLLDQGKISRISDKFHLPNEGIFDEKRQFAQPDHISGPILIAKARIGVVVCHDTWFSDVAETQCEAGAEIILSINASPFEWDKEEPRLQEAIARVVENGRALIYLNLVGAQDGIVFDGHSFVINPDFSRPLLMPPFQEAVYLLDWEKRQENFECVNHSCLWQGDAPYYLAKNDSPKMQEEPEQFDLAYQAICLGLKDFIKKNAFEKVLLGISGGVDSAMVATIAADTLGSENVIGVMLPSPYTQQRSLDDAETLAKNLSIVLHNLPIHDLIDCYQDTLQHCLEGGLGGIAFENVQARIRGSLLMSMSNQLSAMLLTTGNKSEIAVGYCTLYGDMCGSFNPIADLYKTQLYKLCNWRNQQDKFALGAEVIPQTILERPPSAELADDQKDSDSLPEYPVLDDILHGIVEENLSVSALIERGHDKATVLRCFSLLDGAQHKRTQSAIGVKLSSQAMKTQWRYPIINHFSKQDFS